MENLQLAQKIKSDILQKIDSINFLATQRKGVRINCINNFFKKNIEISGDLKTQNQTLSDALLNAMATVIDYYFIYCNLTLGADISKITRVQYKNINNKFIIDNSPFKEKPKEGTSLKWYTEKLKKEIEESSGLSYDKINLNDYWYCYLSSALSSLLHNYGVKIPKKIIKFDFDESNHKLKIPKEIINFNKYFSPFYCNSYESMGVRYSIYLDINNCLKHNTIPYLIYQTETFKEYAEDRVFEFFEIENYKSVFLKDGSFLKDIITISFDDLKEGLKLKKDNDNFEICSLEEKWEIGRIIEIDHVNGYIDEEENSLYFFLGRVLFVKKRDSVLVDANKSYTDTLDRLFKDIEMGIDYFSHKQENNLT